MSTYTKGALDAQIDAVEALNEQIVVLEERLREFYESRRILVAKLQEVCPHDEGFDRKHIPRTDTYGRYLPSLITETCNLCKKIFNRGTERDY